MALVPLRLLLDHAAENGYGIPAFNVNNLEQVQSIMEAAHETDSPVILQASRGARQYAGESFLRHLILAAVETYPDIPVVMHQDHGNSPATCYGAAANGFTSVMMDGSLEADAKTPASYEYNVRVTKEVVDVAHAIGVSVEGELGCLGSLETGQGEAEDGHDGIITGFENRTSKTGNAFGKLIIEDYSGNVEIMLFGKDFVEYNKFMVQGLFVFVKARIQERYNQPGSLEIKLSKIELLDEVKKNAFNRIRLRVKLDKLDEELVLKLDALMNRFEGKSNVEFYVEDAEQRQNIKLYSKRNKVAIDTEFLLELDKMAELSYDLV
jgi:hypothetical protein